jgi:hypothetical protein
MNLRVVGFGKGGCLGRRLPIQPLLKASIVKFFGQRPFQSRFRRQPQVFGDHALGDVQRSGNRLQAQVGAVAVSKYVSYLAHG